MKKHKKVLAGAVLANTLLLFTGITAHANPITPDPVEEIGSLLLIGGMIIAIIWVFVSLLKK